MLGIAKASEDQMKRVLSLSYGKDSLACLSTIVQSNWPLDLITEMDMSTN